MRHVDPDDAPKWTVEMFEHAEISIGGKIIRPATGTLTPSGVRGNPPKNIEIKRQ